MKQNRDKVIELKITPKIYHLCKLKVKSVIGPQRKRNTLEDIPNELIIATEATENPFCTNK